GSYVDRGIVTTTFIQPEGRHIQRRPFMTAFERPRRFRYEYRDENMGDRLVIWQEVPPAKVFWTVKGQTETCELRMAIAGATGISGGSAHTIPRLLIPELTGGWGLTDLEDVLHVGEQLIEGIRCLAIQGRLNS